MEQVEQAKEGKQIFGKVDRNKDGKVKSEYPAWYHQTHIETLRETIDHRKHVLDNDLIPHSRRLEQQTHLKQEESKMSDIEDSRPHFSGTEIDEISKAVKGIGGKIKEAMFTRSQMERGLADAHEVARRWSIPSIQLDAHEISFCKACDVTVSHEGKVTQIGAEKAWKIGRRLLEQGSNSEELRKP